MRKRITLTVIIILLAATLAATYFYGSSRYQARLDEEARLAEIAAFYANPNVTMVVTEKTISELDKYTNLQNVDFSGSECYDAIENFIATHPGVNVTYTVDIGGTQVENTADALTLSPGQFDYQTLVENLKHLPNIATISLPCTDLTMEEITALRSQYENVDVKYTVTFLEQELAEDTTTLDVSGMNMDELEQLRNVAPMLPILESLELMDSNGQSNLSMEDVKVLMEECPGMPIHYTFDFYGTTLSTTTETVELHRVKIGDEGEANIRSALDILPNCSYFKLDNCGVSSEVMASIRDDYPDTKVVWRVFFGKFNCLTDVEMLRITNGLTDDIVGELKYCTDVKYMDAGHDEELTDISFIAYMPKLEICILSGSPITDLSCFQDNQSIEFLELCFCGYIKDLTPLTNCPNLKYLNVSYTKVSDLSPLDNLPIERFNCMKTKTSDAEANRFNSLHPGCMVRFSGTQCYGYGWRYVDDGITFWDYYANMREIFMYDNASYVSGKEYTNGKL